ncbi:hypothetical protein MARPO_0091s0085 [Marchantia polymorpha]|uniref:Uncharacterized protein n=1 Tax=Marchantia polymorpha TaxID=3197 RepID=A0A2R6WHC0_MARPO|nr:hypothetical protein MARPO_0091s0085 [Marchantia polymorpha]|eukprot:PTQ33241.1 hypothetical protein MARPO_0091s0085 [Marchantia polymorpha]
MTRDDSRSSRRRKRRMRSSWGKSEIGGKRRRRQEAAPEELRCAVTGSCEAVEAVTGREERFVGACKDSTGQRRRKGGTAPDNYSIGRGIRKDGDKGQRWQERQSDRSRSSASANSSD